jgi:hypothetical protein
MVVKSVWRGLRENGDSIYNLQHKLARIPSELEPFFKYMLDSIDKTYQEASYSTLAVAMTLAKDEEVEGMTLLRYSFLFDRIDEIQLGQKAPSSRALLDLRVGKKLDLRLERAISRLGARCDCLLETRRARRSSHPAFRDTAKFIHPSIPDFVEGQLRDRSHMNLIEPEEEILRTLISQVECSIYSPTAEVTSEISQAIRLVFQQPIPFPAAKHGSDNQVGWAKSDLNKKNDIDFYDADNY